MHFLFFVKLSLRELRCTTSFLQAVLLSFLCTRVSRQETCCFQCRTAVLFRFQKRTSYTQTDCACLTCVTAADYVYKNVVLSFCFQKHEGLFYNVLKCSLREIVLKSTVVNNDRSVATVDKTNTSDCLLSATCSPELKLLFQICFSHIPFSP